MYQTVPVTTLTGPSFETLSETELENYEGGITPTFAAVSLSAVKLTISATVSYTVTFFIDSKSQIV